jgi:hypothetical protein
LATGLGSLVGEWLGTSEKARSNGVHDLMAYRTISGTGTIKEIVTGVNLWYLDGDSA